MKKLVICSFAETAADNELQPIVVPSDSVSPSVIGISIFVDLLYAVTPDSYRD